MCLSTPHGAACSPATARPTASHSQMISIFESQLSPQGVSRDSPTANRGRKTAVQHEQMQNLHPRCQQGAGSRARAKEHRQRYNNSIMSLVVGFRVLGFVGAKSFNKYTLSNPPVSVRAQRQRNLTQKQRLDPGSHRSPVNDSDRAGR